MAAKAFLGVLLEDSELSQHQLAKLLGLQQGKVSLLVNLKINPTDKEREALETFFGLPADVIFEEVEA